MASASEAKGGHKTKDAHAAFTTAINKPPIPEIKGFREQPAPTTPESPKWESVCDTVYMVNGVRMIVKVTKIYKNKTYYLLCESDNQAEFEIETKKLKRIAYASGKIDSLKQPADDPYDYYHTGGNDGQQQSTIQKRPDLEKATSHLDLAMIFVIAGVFFFPFMIVGYIIASEVRKKLFGQRGYEKAYKKAQALSGISLGCLCVIAVFVFLGLALSLL
jgi:hypothetical protein